MSRQAWIWARLCVASGPMSKAIASPELTNHLLNEQMIRHTDDSGNVHQYRVSDLLELVFWLKEHESTVKQVLGAFEETQASAPVSEQWF